MKNAKPIRSPAEEVRLTSAEESDEIVTTVPYREVAGSLMWLAVCTRPDIAYAVNAVCRHVSKPTMKHWNAAKRILRYLKSTKTVGLRYFENARVSLVGYADSDYAGDESRKSTSGFVFLLNGTPVSLNSSFLYSLIDSSISISFEYIVFSLFNMGSMISIETVLEVFLVLLLGLLLMD